MVEGVPNLEVIARPGQTRSMRFVLDTPGKYMVMCYRRGPRRGRHGRELTVVEAP